MNLKQFSSSNALKSKKSIISVDSLSSLNNIVIAAAVSSATSLFQRDHHRSGLPEQIRTWKVRTPIREKRWIEIDIGLVGKIRFRFRFLCRSRLLRRLASFAIFGVRTITDEESCGGQRPNFLHVSDVRAANVGPQERH